MNGALGLGLAALAVGLTPVPTDPPPDPLAWGYLGVSPDPGTLRLATVQPGTPASRAGLQPGDELVRIGDLKPRSFEDVAEHIWAFRPGTLLKVEVRRGGQTKAFTVRLGVRPAELEPPPIRDRPVEEPRK